MNHYSSGQLEQLVWEPERCESEDAIKQHLRACKQCRQTYESILRLKEAAAQCAREVECPTTEELIACHENKLSGYALRSIQQHLDWCLTCQRALELYGQSSVAREIALANGVRQWASQLGRKVAAVVALAHKEVSDLFADLETAWGESVVTVIRPPTLTAAPAYVGRTKSVKADIESEEHPAVSGRYDIADPAGSYAIRVTTETDKLHLILLRSQTGNPVDVWVIDAEGVPMTEEPVHLTPGKRETISGLSEAGPYAIALVA